MSRHRIVRLALVSTLLALLLTTFMVFTASAHTLAPTHGVTTSVVSIPLKTNPNSNMKVNAHGKVIFNPHKLSCKQLQGQSCNTLTNTTSQTLAVYMNGSFFFDSAPGQVNSFFYGGPGKYVFTIPQTNRRARLIVTVS
jgi:hypothetical protein